LQKTLVVPRAATRSEEDSEIALMGLVKQFAWFNVGKKNSAAIKSAAFMRQPFCNDLHCHLQ
jgi:hypothetical protein